jgi:uncharacterized metal-binding protein YceD (DUF177 family)
MSTPEFSRPIDRRHPKEKPVEIAADEVERKALAKRFGLIAIHRLEAKAALQADGEAVNVNGRFEADIVQTCAVSGEDLPVTFAEPLTLRFVPAREIAEEEIELQEDELDEIPFTGHFVDIGEAVAQSLALAIDPYAAGPDAERVREEKGLADEEASGPFAALAALKETKE